MENKGKYSLFRMDFGDDKVPEFKEQKGKDWVFNGETNNFPDTLIDLFNRSAKHNAIVTGVASMIKGGGFMLKTPDPIAQKFLENPNEFEHSNDILAKVALDLKMFGGFYLQVVWSRDGSKIVQMYHMPFREMRVNAKGTKFYRSEKWGVGHTDYDCFDKFNPQNAKGATQVFYYKEYRPDLKYYPLPDYFGARQYITIDTEISNFHYNNIRSGFSAGKMITMFNGEPTEEEKRAIENNIKKKLTGTDKAGGFVLNFVDRKEQAPEIVNLQPDELDKQYLQLYETVTNEIFIGHRVTSPMIFGVKTEGQLGGRQELQDAKEIFYTDYIKPKVEVIERVWNYLFTWVSPNATVYIEKQNAQDNQAQTVQSMSKQKTEDDILMLFDSCGEPSQNYRVIKSKRLRFDANEDVENEDRFKHTFLADYEFAEPINIEISDSQAKVLAVIKENPQLTIAEISNISKLDVEEVTKAVQYLAENEVIKIEDSGVIKITDRGLKTLNEQDIVATEIFVKYKYTGPRDDKNRNFCAKMLEKDKLYTRADIDNVSEKAGYNVWMQRGGWYHNPKTEVNTPYCRHFWSQVIVKKKR